MGECINATEHMFTSHSLSKADVEAAFRAAVTAMVRAHPADADVQSKSSRLIDSLVYRDAQWAVLAAKADAAQAMVMALCTHKASRCSTFAAIMLGARQLN